MEDFSKKELEMLTSKKGLRKLLKSDNPKIKKVLADLEYEKELEELQVELMKLQSWVQETKQRVAIIFEGRDAAGKGGSIKRFTENLPPRQINVTALPKPTETERGQWYFQRYIAKLPNPGEIVFFDRSWYNRAVVEPVNDFCNESQYERFMHQLPEFEHLLIEDGVILIKFWFNIDQETQQERFEDRREDPLKQWKISPVDENAQELWGKYTIYRDKMFEGTSLKFSPWVIVKADDKKKARLESIKYVLSKIDYAEKGSKGVDLKPDSKIVSCYKS